MTERRQEPRIRVGGVIVGRVKASVPVRVMDISRRGVQIELASPLRPGAACELALPDRDGELRLYASVLRCRAMGFRTSALGEKVLHYRAGLAFRELGAEQRTRLERLLEELPGLCSSGVVAGRRVRLHLNTEDLGTDEPEDGIA